MKELDFTTVMNIVLKKRKKLKFAAIKPVVSDLFMDKNTEQKLVESAMDRILIDNESLLRNLKRTTDMGITFQDLKCDLCKRDVNRTFLAEQQGSSLEYFDENDPLNEQLILFNCTRSEHVNHCFH